MVQYIFDFGGNGYQQINTAKTQSIALTAVGRIKGNFGDAGRYLPLSEVPIKIGLSTNSIPHSHSIDQPLVWMRELSVTYRPTVEKRNLFRVGFFPFKIGTGLALGNGYKVQAPIIGQFTYDQIDQFRPGILAQFTCFNRQMTNSMYVGVSLTRSDNYFNTGLTTNTQNLETAALETGSGKSSICFALQTKIKPNLEGKKLTVNPYLLYKSNNFETVEYPGDASSSLIIPGIYVFFERKHLSFHFEAAKDFGHQHVANWDRNQLLNTGLLPTSNTHLFYAPNQSLTLTTVTNENFMPSPYILPNSIKSLGNGTNFLYPAPDGSGTYIFKNSYDRIRNGYDNTYAGFVVYADVIYKRKKSQIGFAVGCASGDDIPNDSDATILMTRLTPGITYLDTNKKYKGFVGIEQYFEPKGIIPLYLGQAQKLFRTITRRTEFTPPKINNVIFLGSTIGKDLYQKKLLMAVSVIGYMQYVRTVKELSANLTEYLAIDFTEQMRIDMNLRPALYLGTEFNFEIDYRVTPDFRFFAKGAVLIPGSYYKLAQGKNIPIRSQIELTYPDFSANPNFELTLGDNSCFFLGVGLSCDFDLTNLDFLKRKKEAPCSA